MAPHGTWRAFIPGIELWKAQASEKLGRRSTWRVFQDSYLECCYVLGAALVALLLILGAMSYRAKSNRLGDEAVLPERKLNLRAIFEGLADMVSGLLDGVMGEKNARKYLPFLGSFFIFILFSNLISLVP